MRGMTLIEVILALALLSVLTIGATSWIVGTARSSTTVGSRATWETAAQATFRLIRDDLASSDQFEVAPSERVSVAGDRLIIHTRDAGGVATHQYELANAELCVRGLNGARVTVLLDRVSVFESSIDPELRILSVLIRHEDGHELRVQEMIP